MPWRYLTRRRAPRLVHSFAAIIMIACYELPVNCWTPRHSGNHASAVSLPPAVGLFLISAVPNTRYLSCWVDNDFVLLFEYSVHEACTHGRTYRVFVYVACGHGSRASSGGVAIHYVLPVLWVTSCFHIMGSEARHVYGCTSTTVHLDLRSLEH